MAWDRRHFLGGSDAGPALGMSPYKSPFRLWLEKTGREVDGFDEGNARTQAGKIFEAAIIRLYQTLHGGPLPRAESKELVHPDHPWMRGHIDRRQAGTRAIVEAKLVGNRQAQRWGDTDTLNMPQEYLLQVHHYLTCDDKLAPYALVLAMIGTELRVYTVPRDQEISEMLIENEAQFWQQVQSDTPPEPSVRLGDSYGLLYRLSNGTKIVAPEPMRRHIEMIRALNETSAEIDLELINAKQSIMGFMQDHETLIDVDGSELASWRTQKAASRINVAKLKKKYPEIAKDVMVSSNETIRVFRTKRDKPTKPENENE